MKHTLITDNFVRFAAVRDRKKKKWTIHFIGIPASIPVLNCHRESHIGFAQLFALIALHANFNSTQQTKNLILAF